MATTHAASQPTLRHLARTLGLSHAALSKQVHRGALTAGVRLDERDRVVIVDGAEASEQWRTIHTPT